MRVLQQFMSEEYFWIVNDLNTKFWMQSLLRQHHQKVICGDQVLRASELWQKRLLKEEPEWQIISPDLAQFFIEKWLAHGIKELGLPLSSRDRKKAYQTIGQILPLLCHSQGEDVIEEWFSESDEAKERWYDWYLAGKYLWQESLSQKIIPSEWIKGILVNKDLIDQEEARYVFDLGLDIDDVESDLILNLSRVADVEVIIPYTSEPIEPYENLLSRCQPHEEEVEVFKQQKTYRKLPSQLSEVKDAVAQIRAWADEGVPLEKMAIVSSAIENYWPTLSEYLLVEGISFNKNVVTPLSQFEAYQSWLSAIRFSLSQMQSLDGKQLFYSDSDEPVVDYERFKQLFKNVYSEEDFERISEVKDELPEKRNSKDEISFKEFVEWSYSLFKKDQLHYFDQLLQKFDEIYIIDEKLSYEKWLEFFENYFSRNEKTVEKYEGSGISVLSPVGAQNIPFDKMIVLGLSEKNLSESFETALHWTDIESIKIKFGFSLPHADRYKMLQSFEWLEKKNISECLYYHSETDFSGQFQAPSLYWLKGALDSGHNLEMEAPRPTRWDSLMEFAPQNDFSDVPVDMVEDFIARDLGEVKNSPAALESLSLSASSLEEYFKCPFRFFSMKGLKLSDLPSLDLDIDYQTRGRLIHKICELLVLGKDFSLGNEALLKIVDKARDDIEMEVYSEEMWSYFRPYYFKLAQNFMKFEAQWRSEYPSTRTVAVEKFIKAHIQLDDGTIHFTKDSGIPFRGVIDRIDATEEGQFALVDYKSSDSGLTQYKSWLSKGRLQLSLYAMALQEGVITGNAEDVVGAFYYAIKTMDRSKGFSMADAEESFLPKKKMSKEDLEKLMNDTKKMTFDLVSKMEEGIMGPEPFDYKICNDCQWNKVCRHPNLNQ